MSAVQRVARVVTGVIRQAMADAGARALVVLDDGSLEATLVHDWCAEAVGANFVTLARGTLMARDLRRTLASHPAAPELAGIPGERLAEEARRLEARLLAEVGGGPVLVANPAHKTTLLLAPVPPPEPLLPLGDLYATDLQELVGGCALAGTVLTLAELAGGLAALDDALRAYFDQRRPLADALRPLPEEARTALAQAIDGARFARRRPGLVPKLGPRTLGIDLFA